MSGVGGKPASIASIVIVVSVFIEATYGVYRSERIMRSKLNQMVRLTARVSRWQQNIPDPGKDKESIEVYLIWGMWAEKEIMTDQLALNLIYIKKKGWWQFWKKAKSPAYGMSRNGADSNQYRRTLAPPGALQPDRDDGVFTWVRDKKTLKNVKGFELELVLTTGMPVGRYTIPEGLSLRYELLLFEHLSVQKL